MSRRPARSTRFPDTTLFRSRRPGLHRREDLVGLALADQLPDGGRRDHDLAGRDARRAVGGGQELLRDDRSAEHTSELQSRQYLVCRLLLDKKNTLDLIRTPL